LFLTNFLLGQDESYPGIYCEISGFKLNQHSRRASYSFISFFQIPDRKIFVPRSIRLLETLTKLKKTIHLHLANSIN